MKKSTDFSLVALLLVMLFFPMRINAMALRGDVNGDGEVSITDAMQVMELAAQGSTNPQADINSDGKVTTADANPIIDHVMGNKKL
jgi:hypothetical protein